VVSLVRSILPWKGDKLTDMLLKVALIAAVVAVVYTGSMTATERIAVNHTVQSIQEAVSVYTQPPAADDTDGLPEGYLDKFAALYAVNTDIKGWLTIPGTNIDLPIMQAEDNDYYLSHDLYGEKDPYGLPYIDYRVPIEPDDSWAKNTIIYGHNMNAGYVFHELIGYRDAEFYQEHPFLTFDTVYNQSEWVVFAAFEANTDSYRGEVFEYYNYVISRDPERAQWYIDETTSRSYFTCSVDVNTDDVFLTLQTCSNNSTDTKLCIVARKLREGESEEDFDFSGSVNNTSRVRPTFY
jgi:SrtB family sortase